MNSYNIYLTCQKGRLKIKEYPQLDMKISKHLGKGEKKVSRSQVMDLILRPLEDLAAPCYYLPAARSGILQGHKMIAASIVRSIRKNVWRDMNMTRIVY